MSELTDRAYLALQPDERFRAALSAAARHDGYELDRLIATCERKIYRLEDQDFAYPLRGFALLAERQKAHVTRMVLSAVSLAFIEETLDNAGEARVGESVDKLRAGLKGHVEAWETFCSELGMTDEETAVMAGIEGDEVLSLNLRLLELDSIEADDEQAARHIGKLREAWAHWQ